jgi:hypothetical protein
LENIFDSVQISEGTRVSPFAGPATFLVKNAVGRSAAGAMPKPKQEVFGRNGKTAILP